MSSAYDYSSTAASNNGATPNGWPEGQPPSSVNDCARQMQACIAEFVHSAIAGGTADALTVTFVNPPAALTDGMELHLRAAAANATTTPTLNLNALGAKTITKLGGAALVPGDIVGNLHETSLRYNLANTRWELMNPGTVSALTAPVTLPASGSIDSSGNLKTAAVYAGTGAIAAGVLSARISADHLFSVGGANGLTDGVAVNSTNDASNANKGLEFRGSNVQLTAVGANAVTVQANGHTAVTLCDSSGNTTIPGNLVVGGTISGQAFSAKFTDTGQAIPAGGATLSRPHGLGAAPFGVIVLLHCTTINAGYAVGDEVVLASGVSYDGTNPIGINVWSDATNVNVVLVSTGLIDVYHKTTGTRTQIVNTDWTIIIKAWV